LHFGGLQGLVGVCPINHKHCYVYCIHGATAGERRDPTTLHAQLREKLEGYGGLIPGLASQLNDPTLVSYRPIEWMLVPAPWHRGRVVLIGDERVKLVVDAFTVARFPDRCARGYG
jgi:hypothetical protein